MAELSIVEVRRLIKDGALAVRPEGVRQVPAVLVADDTVLKHLPGVLTLLRYAWYNDGQGYGGPTPPKTRFRNPGRCAWR